MTTILPNGSKPLRPGDRATRSGIYRAVHLRHRMPHELTVLEDEILPACKKCGENVRFELMQAAPRLKGDVDLLVAACAVLLLVFSAVLC